MYEGLTISDKPALLDAKARGAEWVARDTNNDLYGYAVEPIDDATYGWTTPFIGNVITINSDLMEFVLPHEKVNIDLALAQIAEMEREQRPRTNQDALTDEWKLDVKKMARATVSEHVWKADGLVWYGFQIAGSLMRGYVTELDDAIERQAAYLLSPAEDGK